jgi:segregation and condensation protein B
METLAIIAYKQPITKAEIERIRGVGVGHTLRLLLEYELIKTGGRKDVPGKPVLYTTTDKFLQFFGLLSLKDLPSLSEYEET